MSERFILNEFSYFGRGSRADLVPEIKKRNFKKIFVVTDDALVKCGVAQKVTCLFISFSVASKRKKDIYKFSITSSSTYTVKICYLLAIQIIQVWECTFLSKGVKKIKIFYKKINGQVKDLSVLST